MAFGTASTGTAIASLSGVAATNATLAALGGGAIAAGGGGMALGTTLLGATTFGVGLLVGGVIFNFTGGKLSDKADEAWSQMKEAEEKIDAICKYLEEIKDIATHYIISITKVNSKYKDVFGYVSHIVNKLNKNDWNKFSESEKMATQSTVLLVGLLYDMCKVSLVEKSDGDEEMNSVNQSEINESMEKANSVLRDLGWE